MEHEAQSVVLWQETRRKGDGVACGGSGLMLTSGWILSHGSLLSSSLLESLAIDFLDSVQRELERDLVPVPSGLAEKLQFRAQCFAAGQDKSFGGVEARRIEDKTCSLRVVWRCSQLRRIFSDLLFPWTFRKSNKFDKLMLSIFLLLRVDGEPEVEDCVADARQCLNEFYAKNLESRSAPSSPRRGLQVEIESTPFGNPAYLESISRGIVSNVLGDDGCVILTDASSVPGCEGAPLYILQEAERHIYGLVIAPLSWCRGEWVNYTFAGNLQVCLRKILRRPDRIVDGTSLSSFSDVGSTPPLPLLELLDKSLVVIKSSSGWGTGVIINVPTGTIVTCSHVVREARGSLIKVALGETQTFAQLVYRTDDGLPYDVAVLSLRHPHENLRALPLAAEATIKGTPVLTAGFPFFGDSAPSSCSLGVVSRVTDSMLQTTCRVQSGSSGGPVVDRASGEMLGLVVSNARADDLDPTSGTLYPRFNMAVPVTVLRAPLLEYVASADVRCLENLSSNDPKVQELWKSYLCVRSKM